MTHIEHPGMPGRSYCDPHGAVQDGLIRDGAPFVPGTVYCPACLRIKSVCDADLARARLRQQPPPRPV